MTRRELVQWIAGQSRYLDQAMVDKALHHLFAYMAECLKQGCRIEIRRFGTFSLHHRQPRMARNPKTGAILYTEEKYIPHFKPGKALREQVNEAFHQSKRESGWTLTQDDPHQDYEIV
ncbi:MAG TPA: HU family DNA-binding protein [Gammaproteobacteria bacterium]|nr:HU family DNA-binding protein [Gammaproteobacteria bacterium]